MLMRTFTFCVLVALLIPESSNGTLLRWTVQGEGVPTGGTLSGFFDYDPQTGEFGDWSLSIVGGWVEMFPPYTWDPSTSPTPHVSDYWDPLQTFIFGYSNTDSRQLRLTPNSELTGVGDVATFDHAHSIDCFNCLPGRGIQGQLVGEVLISVPRKSWGAIKGLYRSE